MTPTPKPATTSKSERFEMRLDEDTLERVDAWRAQQPDFPTRSEAMRRLVEQGLARASSKAIALSDGEKLLALMLRDIYKGLKLKGGETDFDFIAQVIFGGHYWAPTWKLSGVFHGHADKEEDVRFVVDVLDMWSFIEGAHAKLSQKNKDRIAKEAAPFGTHVQFVGFDGNNESELFSIARFVVDDMNRFTEFQGRELNSHAPTRARYERMLTVFRPLRDRLVGVSLDTDQLIAILKARA